MKHSESVKDDKTTCPTCNQEGRCITCTSGNRQEVIFFHPLKTVHTFCRVSEETVVSGESENEPAGEDDHETDVA
jgi:hypothetical protein